MISEAIFQALIASDNLAADDALVAALAEAEPHEQPPIVEAILHRDRPAGLVGLVVWYHRLTDVLQDSIVAIADRLYGALRDACSYEAPQVRLNIVSIIAAARRWRLAYLLASLLRDGAPRVREAAALALRDMVEAFLDEAQTYVRRAARERGREHDPLRRHDLLRHAEDRKHLAQAVGAALESFDTHHHPPVVEAAIWMVDDLAARFWAVMEPSGSHARRAAQEVLPRTLTDRWVPFAYDAVARDSFRSMVLRRLTNDVQADSTGAWLAHAWRLADPSIRNGFRLVRHWPALLAALERLQAMRPDDQVRAVRILAHTGLSIATKIEQLEGVIRRAASPARRQAVWALCTMEGPESTSLLRTVAESGPPELAAIARREIKRRTGLTAARHEPGDIDESFVPFELDLLWQSFDALDEDEQAARAQDVLSRTEDLAALIELKLSSADATVRLHALRILMAAGQVRAAELAIYSLAHDPDTKVRSAAMMALSQLATPTAARLLHAALADEDDRVRANAVEALERDPAMTHDPEVHARLHDDDNRTRGNAAKALLKHGVREAAETICRMLRDDDPQDRASALWVVGEMHLAPLVKRVTEMADGDPDPDIRHRARDVLDALAAAAAPAQGGT
jgi:hypothetical protein